MLTTRRSYSSSDLIGEVTQVLDHTQDTFSPFRTNLTVVWAWAGSKVLDRLNHMVRTRWPNEAESDDRGAPAVTRGTLHYHSRKHGMV